MTKDITLAQARALYTDHFKKPMPKDLPYINAATMVLKEVGWEEFMNRLDAIIAAESTRCKGCNHTFSPEEIGALKADNAWNGYCLVCIDEGRT